MTDHLPPPSPLAFPHGRVLPPANTAPMPDRRRALVTVPQPDLARRQLLDKTRGRLVMAASGFALLFGAAGLKLTIATVLDPKLPRPVVAVRVSTGETPAGRAAITDRNGEVLASSLPVTALVANPHDIGSISRATELADKVRAVLPDMDRDLLIARLSPRTAPGTERPVQYAYVARGLTPRQMQLLVNQGVIGAGMEFEAAERRVYPQGSTAVHMLGQVNVDGEGIAGAERWYDERLRQNPAPLRLSIDVRVQLALRDAVRGAIADFNGIGGAGVVMDVNTAEVLAMVSLPDFNANDPMSASHCAPELNRTTNICERFNRVTSGVYEPGSTFKLITAAMALEAGTVNLWSGYDASRPIRIGRFTISDYKGKGRFLMLPEIIAYSSNIGTAHMAVAVGPVRHREFLRTMGMLGRQGVELPEAAHPLAPSAASWREINTMTIGFGHGIAVTPLHVVTGISALANGGILRQPTILAQQPGATREGTRVVTERTSDTIRRLMRLVVTDGSGKSAEVPGYFVGGKTGTAQKTDAHGHYLENKRIAAFVGAFPMNAPRYALYVMVDEPSANAHSHGYATAGWVAAPAANAVISRIAPILGLVPETDRIPQIQAAISLPMQPARPPRATTAAAPPAAPAAGTGNVRQQPGPAPIPPPPAIRRTAVDPATPAGLRLVGTPETPVAAR